MFGPRIARAFETVKDAFDPAALLNPGRVVRPPRMDDRSLFRYGPDYAPAPGFTPQLDWSAHPGPLGGMLGAVEMCNNNGTCRAFTAEVMCPSFRVTRDERHVTRGRANTLRLALTGQLGPDAMASDALAEAMALCVSCKACRRECPTGVDMARMKLEVLAARAATHPVPLRERLVAALPALAPFAARAPWLANLRNRSALLRRAGEARLGLAADRALPAFRADPFRDSEARAYVSTGARGEVILLADTFNRWFEPENLRAALAVLTAAGYRVRLPSAPGRPLCCGRTQLAAGRIDQARAEARRTLAALAGEAPVVGLEPSCLFTLRDEFPALLPGPRNQSARRPRACCSARSWPPRSRSSRCAHCPPRPTCTDTATRNPSAPSPPPSPRCAQCPSSRCDRSPPPAAAWPAASATRPKARTPPAPWPRPACCPPSAPRRQKT